MARLSTFWATMDMSAADLSDLARGRGRIINDHTLKLKLNGDEIVLKGDFDISKKGQLTGGDVKSIDFGYGEYAGMHVSRINVDIGLLTHIAKTKGLGDDAALLADMLSGSDSITGNLGNDIAYGLGGNDKLTGGFGDDALYGGDGNDILNGGSDADSLYGGLGVDIFYYGSASDSFETFGIDVIYDFSQTEGDKISLIDVGFFDFADDVEITNQNGDTIVRVDTQSQAGTFMIIRIDGAVPLTASDFIL